MGIYAGASLWLTANSQRMTINPSDSPQRGLREAVHSVDIEENTAVKQPPFTLYGVP
jgi:hypothetical protein